MPEIQAARAAARIGADIGAQPGWWECPVGQVVPVGALRIHQLSGGQQPRTWCASISTSSGWAAVVPEALFRAAGGRP